MPFIAVRDIQMYYEIHGTRKQYFMKMGRRRSASQR